VFIDESAASPRTCESPIGLLCFDFQRPYREMRWSVLPALTMNGYIQDPLIVQGSVTTALFEGWFENKVLPQLVPGMVVVMDNASCHRSELVRPLCPDHSTQLELLPPYSPDLNPIKKSTNVLKAWVMRHVRMACIFVDFGASMAHVVEEVHWSGIGLTLQLLPRATTPGFASIGVKYRSYFTES
jgi:hypothetical protein